MKSLVKLLSVAALMLGLALTGAPAQAQQAPPASPPPTLKPASPAAIAAAKELLAMKGAGGVYAQIIPNVVQRTKDALIQSNLNYQKDLTEVAIIVVKTLAGLLNAIPGVVEHGLFIGLASTVVLAGAHGIRVVERP